MSEYSYKSFHPTYDRPHICTILFFAKNNIEFDRVDAFPSLIHPLVSLRMTSKFLTFPQRSGCNPCVRSFSKETAPIRWSGGSLDNDRCNLCGTINEFLTLIFCDGKGCNKAYHTE